MITKRRNCNACKDMSLYIRHHNLKATIQKHLLVLSAQLKINHLMLLKALVTVAHATIAFALLVS